MAGLLAKCHPDRLHKAYGMCAACYQRSTYSVGTPQYGRELVEYVESHPGATWSTLSERLANRSRERLAASLIRSGRRDLIARVDSASGKKPKPKPYGKSLVRMIEMNPQADWVLLERVFERNRNQMKNTLRGMNPPRIDLLKIVSANTKEVV